MAGRLFNPLPLLRLVLLGTLAVAQIALAADGATQSAPPPTVAAELPARLPAQAFARDADVSRVRMSPGGKLLAWADGAAQEPYVTVYDIATARVLNHFRVSAPLKLSSLVWADDTNLLMTVHFTDKPGVYQQHSYEIFRVLAYDVASGNTTMLLMGGGDRAIVTGAGLVCACGPRPGTVLMSTLDRSATRAHAPIDTRIARKESESAWSLNLYVVDLKSGEGKVAAYGTPFTYDWFANDDLSVVVRADDNSKKHFSMSVKQGSTWTSIYESDAMQPSMEAIAADHKSIVITGPDASVRRRLWSVPLDGSGSKALGVDDGHDVAYTLVDRFSHELLATVADGTGAETRWFSPAAEARARALGKSFGGLQVDIYDRSFDNTRVIASASDASHPEVYYLVDFATHRADIVGEAYPELANLALGEVSWIHVKARDGYDIPALLTLPHGRPAKGLPLIVMPHGGPESHDDLVYDWWAQFMANRGYAVIQPQFRGSTGFGDAHRQAGRRQWGKLMQDDVTDSVTTMIARGTADPKRICIVGASYGGYAALAGVAFTPELYACAVSVGGVSNLPRMLVYEKDIMAANKWTDPGVSYWVEHIGLPTDADVVAKSPLAAADRIRAPVLLVHGVDDTVVPFLQSQQMYDVMKQAGKNVSLVKLDGEDHWLSRAQTRIRMLTEIEAFLARYLDGAGTP